MRLPALALAAFTLTACIACASGEAPLNLAATPATTSSVILTWRTPSDPADIDYYVIYRNGTQLSDHPTQNTVTLSVPAGTSYTFTIAAHYLSSGGIGSQSTPVTASPLQSDRDATILYADSTLPTDITDGTYSVASRSASGSDGNAYNTVQAAVFNMKPGDTLYLRGGTFHETNIFVGQLASGRADAWYTIASYPGEWAVVDGQHNLTIAHTSTYNGCIFRGTTRNGAQGYVKFERLEITGGGLDLTDAQFPSAGAGIRMRGGPFIFRHLYIHNNYGGSSENGAGLQLENGTGDTLVEYCRFKANGQIKGGLTTSVANLIIFADYAYQNAVTRYDATTGYCAATMNNEVRYNLFEADSGLSVDGVPCYSVTGFKHKGMQRQTGYLAVDSGYSTDLAPNDASLNATGDRIHHNIFLDHPIAVEVDQDYTQVYNNIIWCKDWGNFTGNAIQGRDANSNRRGPHDLVVYNNTIFGNGVTAINHHPVPQGWPTATISGYDDVWPADLPQDVPYAECWFHNNLLDNPGTAAWHIGKITVQSDAVTCTAYPLTDIHLGRNYFYNTTADSLFYIHRTYYDKTGIEGTPCADKVFWQALDTSDHAFSADYSALPTLAAKYLTRGDHVIEGAYTIANAGIGGAHPYLSGVTLPTYIGATNPDDNAWVEGVMTLGALDATGIPAYLRDAPAGDPTWIEGSVTPADTTAPTVPASLTGSAASPTQIGLTWTASTDNVGVTGYRIYRGGTQVGTSTTAACTDSGLTAATTYAYTVAAYDSAGNASAQCTAVSVTTSTSPDTTAPSIPTNLSGTATSSTAISLVWAASTDAVGVAGYRIYRGGTLVGTAASASYSDSGLTAATTYSYTVAAYDATGNASAQCTAVTVTTSAAPDTTVPSVPANLAGTATSSTAVRLTWTASTDNVGVAGYRVYRGGTLVGTAASASYSDTGLTAATAYSYTVAAYDDAGNASAQCTAVSVTTSTSPDTTAPSIPTNLSGTATSSTSISLVWTASTDAVGVSGYRIYRGGTQVGTSTTASYNDSGLTAATAYSYTVAAYDAAGNASAQCTAVNATTQIAGAQTLTVSDATGLQAALNTAAANPSATYTIAVSAGTYTPASGLTLSASNLTLEGSGIISGAGLSSGALLTISGQNTVVSDLTFRDTSGAAISIAAGANVGAIADCTFVGAGIAGTDCSGWTLTGNSFSDTTAAALAFGGADNLTITDNVIVDCVQAIALSNLSSPKVRNNFVADNRVSGTAACIVLTGVSAAQIDNNSLYQAGPAANAIEYSGSVAVGAIRNNLANKPIAATGTATATLAANSTAAAADWFVAPTTGDLHLASARSAVVDAGTTLADLTVDIDGDTRPNGPAYDIGADEYQSDTVAPAAPTGLSATASSATRIALSWSAPTDAAPSGVTPTGVSGYRIYRNGTAVGTSTTTGYSDTGLTSSTTYTYTVTAYDGAANESAASSSASATTETASSDSGNKSSVDSGGGGANHPLLIVALLLLYAFRRKQGTA